MIWNSIPLMTAFDLLIIAVTIYGMWRCRSIGANKRPWALRIGKLLIVLGLLVVCLFYVADLVSMYVLPETTSPQEAMAFMDVLHRNLSWPLVLLICFGLVEVLRELQKREVRLRRLVDANIIGVLIWGPDGQIIDANEAFLRIVEYGRDDLLSGRLRWRELTPAEWRDADEQCAAELESTGTARPYEKEYFRKSGSRVPVLVGTATFEGSRDAGVAFVLDLTDRKRAEAAALESQRRYHEVEIQLAHASRVATMGQLAASIGHEVKQPIAATVTDADAALRWLGAQPADLEETREALQRIVKNGKRASEVIQRIHAFIKKAPPRKDGLAINDAILDVVALTRGEAVKNGIAVQTQLAEGLPLIEGDRVQLQQVVLNLIVNAVEAISALGEGPRELLISTDRAEANGVSVSVQDSGPGLDAASFEQVFDAFYTTKHGGLGMGLSICRSIIEAHGGQLWATASEPRGATFSFTLPAHSESLR